MLNDIKTLLNIEVNLEEMKLENGTVITTESLEKGNEVFIVTDDEKVAMPVGEYILEDGKLLIVEEEGIIADVRDVSDDVPAKEEITEDLEEEEEMADVADWEGMEKRIQNLEDAIADLKGDKVEKSEEEEKEEMSEEVKEEVKVRSAREKLYKSLDNSFSPIIQIERLVDEIPDKIDGFKEFQDALYKMEAQFQKDQQKVKDFENELGVKIDSPKSLSAAVKDLEVFQNDEGFIRRDINEFNKKAKKYR